MFDNGVVLEVLTQIRAQAAGCVDTAAWTLPDGDLVACLDAVTGVLAQLAAVQAHLVREVEGRGVPAAQDASGVVAWLRQRLRISAAAAKRLVELARELDRRPALDAAVGVGGLNAEQAAVIASGLRELAGQPQVEPAVVDKAETVLIDYAGRFDPAGLRALSGRVLAHVAPDVADRVDAAVLARQEARARHSRALQLTPAGDGRVRLTGWLDTEAAAVVTAALDPLCAPHHRRPGHPDPRPGELDPRPGELDPRTGRPDPDPARPTPGPASPARWRASRACWRASRACAASRDAGRFVACRAGRAG